MTDIPKPRSNREILREMIQWSEDHELQGLPINPPGTPDDPNIDDDPTDVMREELASGRADLAAAVKETDLPEETVHMWVREGAQHIPSEAALLLTAWSYRKLLRPYPPQVKRSEPNPRGDGE